MLLTNLVELIREVVNNLLVTRFFLGHRTSAQRVRTAVNLEMIYVPHKLVESHKGLVNVGIGIRGGVM